MTPTRMILAAALTSAFAVAGCSGDPLPPDKRDYAGNWQAAGFLLMISPDGGVAYKRVKGSSTTTVNGPIKEWKGDGFAVGIWFLSTTFEVTQPPHEVEGVWKMTVDGVELTRTTP